MNPSYLPDLSCLLDGLPNQEESLVYSSSESESGDTTKGDEASGSRRAEYNLRTLLPPRRQDYDEESNQPMATSKVSGSTTTNPATKPRLDSGERNATRQKDVPSIISWSNSESLSCADDVSVLCPDLSPHAPKSDTVSLEPRLLQRDSTSRSILSIGGVEGGGGGLREQVIVDGGSSEAEQEQRQLALAQSRQQQRSMPQRFFRRMSSMKRGTKKSIATTEEAEATTPTEKKNDGLVPTPSKKYSSRLFRRKNPQQRHQQQQVSHEASNSNMLRRIFPKTRKGSAVSRIQYETGGRGSSSYQPLCRRGGKEKEREEEVCIEFFDELDNDDLSEDDPTVPTVSTAPTSVRGDKHSPTSSCTGSKKTQAGDRSMGTGKHKGIEDNNYGECSREEDIFTIQRGDTCSTSRLFDSGKTLENTPTEKREPNDIDGILGDLVHLMEELEIELKDYNKHNDEQRELGQEKHSRQRQKEKEPSQPQKRGIIGRRQAKTGPKKGKRGVPVPSVPVKNNVSNPVRLSPKTTFQNRKRTNKFQKLDHHREPEEQEQLEEHRQTLLREVQHNNNKKGIHRYFSKSTRKSKKQRSSWLHRHTYHHHNGHVYSAVE